MPPSDLTIECRAIAQRMRDWSRISGNLRFSRQMANEDLAVIGQLREALHDLADPPAPGDLVASLDNVRQHMEQHSNVAGNLGLLPFFVDDAATVEAGATFLDDHVPTPVPRGIGLLAGASIAAPPLLQMDAAHRPLDAALVDGVVVRIEGTGWVSLDGLSFPIVVASRVLSQFSLTGADTSAETTGAAAGAAVWLDP